MAVKKVVQHVCIKEDAFAFNKQRQKGMEQTQKAILGEIKAIRQENKDQAIENRTTFATKEELNFTKQLQEEKNQTMVDWITSIKDSNNKIYIWLILALIWLAANLIASFARQ